MCALWSREFTCISFQQQQSGTLGNSVVRCDKLDQSEIKSLLMCFLYVLKSMSDGA